MRVAEKLPGILRWFEIVEQQPVLLSPIQVAIDSMERKNSELRTLVESYKGRRTSDVRNLTMSLNGTIDAAVSGGFSKYQEVCVRVGVYVSSTYNGALAHERFTIQMRKFAFRDGLEPTTSQTLVRHSYL